MTRLISDTFFKDKDQCLNEKIEIKLGPMFKAIVNLNFRISITISESDIFKYKYAYYCQILF